MTLAQTMEANTANLSGWSWGAFPDINLKMTFLYQNQYGKHYVFEDGSEGSVFKGSAKLIAKN